MSCCYSSQSFANVIACLFYINLNLAIQSELRPRYTYVSIYLAPNTPARTMERPPRGSIIPDTLPQRNRAAKSYTTLHAQPRCGFQCPYVKEVVEAVQRSMFRVQLLVQVHRAQSCKDSSAAQIMTRWDCWAAGMACSCISSSMQSSSSPKSTSSGFAGCA